MNFTRAKPGGWALFEILTSAQMNLIDTQLELALDGASGGIYSPTGALTWRNKWVVDTSIGGFPTGAAISVVCDTGRTGILSEGGADGGRGGQFKGGLRTLGLLTLGGASDNASAAGDGFQTTGGNNVSTGVAGKGLVAFGGSGINGAIGAQITGGAADVAGGFGGRGVDVFGGAGLTTGAGGHAFSGQGGAAPGAGTGGRGASIIGGTSVSGLGGYGLFALGGVGPTIGGGIGVVGIGAGSSLASPVGGAGGMFVAGTAAGSIGLAAISVPGSTAAFIASSVATGGPAIQAFSLGSNTAIQALSTGGDGYAIEARADSSTPVRAPLHLGTQDANPSTAVDGDITFGSSTHPSGPRMFVYQTAGLPAWQSVVTNLTKESIKSFASCSGAAGVLTVQKSYNSTPTIVGAGANSRVRFTFAIPFVSAFDYQPNADMVLATADDRYAVITDTQPGFFEVAIYDISLAAYQQLDGGAGIAFALRVSVAGSYD